MIDHSPDASAGGGKPAGSSMPARQLPPLSPEQQAAMEAMKQAVPDKPPESVPKQDNGHSKPRKEDDKHNSDKGKKDDHLTKDTEADLYKEPSKGKEEPEKEKPKPKKTELKSESENKVYLYPEKIDLPQRTGDAVDKSLLNMGRLYLDGGEVRRMSWARTTLPFALGIGAGILKPWNTLLGNLGWAGIATGILSPLTSVIRRVTGENAFSQFARFANRREDRSGISGLASRLVHGGESRVVKSIYFREDKDMRQLLRLSDQRANIRDLQIGSRDRINNLIAAGVLAEMKAQMIAEHNIQISPKESEKIARLHEAYEMSKELFKTKIPTEGQRQIFINEILPDLMRTKERNLWMQQTAAVTGVGILKSSAMVLLGHIFTSSHIINLGKSVGDAFAAFGNWSKNIGASIIQPALLEAGKIPDNISKWIDIILGKTTYPPGYGPFGQTPNINTQIVSGGTGATITGITRGGTVATGMTAACIQPYLQKVK